MSETLCWHARVLPTARGCVRHRRLTQYADTKEVPTHDADKKECLTRDADKEKCPTHDADT